MSALTVEDLSMALEQSWTRQTSADPSRWSEKNPAWGQCAITAVIVQDYFGGQLIRAHVPSTGMTHYWNVLPDSTITDLTRSQFPDDVDFVDPEVRDRQYVLSFIPTIKRYETLKNSVKAYLEGTPSTPEEVDPTRQDVPAVLLKNAKTGRYYTNSGVYVPSSFSYVVEHNCGHSASHLIRSLLTPGGEKGCTIADETPYQITETQTKKEQKEVINAQISHLQELAATLNLENQSCPKCKASEETLLLEAAIQGHINSISSEWGTVEMATVQGTPGQQNVARKLQVRILDQASLKFDDAFIPEADPFSRSVLLSMLAQSTGVQTSVSDFYPGGRSYQLFSELLKWVLMKELLAIDNPKTLFSINSGLNRATSSWASQQQFIYTRFRLAETAVRAVLAILHSDNMVLSVKHNYELLSRVSHVTDPHAPLDVLLRASEEVCQYLKSDRGLVEALLPYVTKEPLATEWHL